jgi:hypothetical protein
MAVNLAMITLSENEVTKRLAAYAALVAVPTLIAGIYGMNFEHMPSSSGAWATRSPSRSWPGSTCTSSAASARRAGSSLGP